jgi:nitrite transporter NirC
MPIPITTALDDQAALAATKADNARDLPRYLVLSMLAGIYVGVAIVLLVSVSAPLFAEGAAATKLVSGAVFGLALTLVVFAGAELFTGNTMTMLQGLRAGTVRRADLGLVWVASLVGNLVGSVAVAAAVHGAGTLSGGPGEAMIAAMVDGKNAAAGPQLFWRAVLCNFLVCLALWMAGRVQGDVAKAIVLWWALLAFIGSGFEHSVANMTTFSLGIFAGNASVADLARNLLWTVPGNVVGGGLLVGVAYSWLGGTTKTPATAATSTDAEPILAGPAPAAA